MESPRRNHSALEHAAQHARQLFLKSGTNCVPVLAYRTDRRVELGPAADYSPTGGSRCSFPAPGARSDRRASWRWPPGPAWTQPARPVSITAETSLSSRCLCGAQKRFGIASSLLRPCAPSGELRCPCGSAFLQNGFLKPLHRRRPKRPQLTWLLR